MEFGLICFWRVDVQTFFKRKRLLLSLQLLKSDLDSDVCRMQITGLQNATQERRMCRSSEYISRQRAIVHKSVHWVLWLWLVGGAAGERAMAALPLQAPVSDRFRQQDRTPFSLRKNGLVGRGSCCLYEQDALLRKTLFYHPQSCGRHNCVEELNR